MVEASPRAKSLRSPRSSGVVTPRVLKWHQRLAASLIYYTIRAVSWTLDYEWELHPALLNPELGPVIFATWHNRLFLSLIMHEGCLKRRNRANQLAAIVSASKDGGVVARILEHFGVQPVRGSTSRRGPQALLELSTWAERGYDVAITPDGPRGPRYVVQSGVVALAHVTHLPVVPASSHLSWKISLKSWDRFQIPMPFSRCVIRFGEPMRLSSDATEEERERFRREFEERLKGLTID